MKKERMLKLLSAGTALLLMAGCGSKESSSKAEEEFDSSQLSSEKVTDLSQWNGEWDSFSEYCLDEELDSAWKLVSDGFGIDDSEFKEYFRRLCFVPDDVIEFKVDGKTVSGYNTKNEEVFSHDYEYAATFASDSEGTVLKGDVTYVFKTDDEDAGLYKYICFMPICSMENNGGYMTEHFHFKYGDSIDMLMNFSNIPTMMRADATEGQKNKSIITFFAASNAH